MNEWGNEIINFFQNIILLKYLPDLNTNTSYGIIFIFGLLSSFHCIIMCGGFTISQVLGSKVENKKKFNGYLLYNASRIISYTIVGGLAGGIGSVLGFTEILKGIVPIIGGIFIIITAINQLGFLKFLRKFNWNPSLKIIRKIGVGRNYGPIFLGLISGIMPCVPLQTVELYALGSKSIIVGSFSMFLFGIGTLPVLMIFGTINSRLNRRYTVKIAKVGAILVFILGFSLINRGFALFGANAMDMKMESKDSSKVYTSYINGGSQNLITELEKDSFPEIRVQKDMPVKWIIEVEKDRLNECNNEIVISELNIDKHLKEGENIIEFTPKEIREIPYTCGMGMIKSKISVVDKIDSNVN
ncbi:sulfite exporter TauE/SafE family protein [Clostridium beijerinckii]|uniref:sulfite exporter TauE/SafE family protein n=1 Tax=Clostridium beijerinckii TaxID=1520 RepID=UPI00156F8F70|nr:sulfite exporter TauE/SafE family protein [Clostridium beijerinckii]NRT75235.1 sulfite exporter TauE/SafE [Clostridium beijerinckii]